MRKSEGRSGVVKMYWSMKVAERSGGVRWGSGRRGAALVSP